MNAQRHNVPIITGVNISTIMVGDLLGDSAGMRSNSAMIDSNDEAMRRLSQENRALQTELQILKERLAELERLADTDTLVPLPNRRAFLRELERVVHHMARYGTPSAVLFVDLNGLKAINDRFGHLAGDAVLQHVSSALKENLRAADTVARIGGDEFGLILHHLDEAAAQAKAQSLVAAVAHDGLPVGEHQIGVRVTAGLAMIRDGDDVQSVLARADAAMYAQRSER